MRKNLTKICYGLSAFALASLLTFNSCKESDPILVTVQFDNASLTINENEKSNVNLTLSQATSENKLITISVTHPEAGYGVDFTIEGLLFLTEEFAFTIPKNSTTASFSIAALKDYLDEADEKVTLTIKEVSSGLKIGEKSSTEISLHSVKTYPEENRAISFDGVDDYIDLGNIYDNLALPVTISAWVWIDPTANISQQLPIFDSQDGLPTYNGLTFVTGPSIGITYGDGQGENNLAYRRSKSALITPTTSRWVNVTAVMRGATDMDVYFNGYNAGGTYAGSSNLPMNSNSPNEVAKVGLYNANGIVYRFKGLIDELKIWNRSLSESEIQKVIFEKTEASSQGLIGYWNFDEPEGNQVSDASNNHFTGTLKNNPTRVLSGAPIKK